MDTARSPSSQTRSFFNTPMIEVLFHTRGSVLQLRFSKLQSKEEKSVDGDTVLSLYYLSIRHRPLRGVYCYIPSQK